MAADKGNPLGTKGIERFLRGLFNPQGPARFGQDLLGPIQPSIEARPTLRWDPLFSTGVVPWAFEVNAGAVAGQLSGWELSGNPTYDIYILGVRTSVEGIVRLSGTADGLATQSRPVGIDSDISFGIPVAFVQGLQSQSGAVAAPGGTPIHVTIAGVAWEPASTPIAVLRSVTSWFKIHHSVANVAIIINAWGVGVPKDLASL